jgi:hypothetical protein
MRLVAGRRCFFTLSPFAGAAPRLLFACVAAARVAAGLGDLRCPDKFFLAAG